MIAQSRRPEQRVEVVAHNLGHRQDSLGRASKWADELSRFRVTEHAQDRRERRGHEKQPRSAERLGESRAAQAEFVGDQAGRASR